MAKSKGRTIFSLILLIISYILLIVGFVFLLKSESNDDASGMVLGAVLLVLFAVSGTISHLLLGRFGECSKGQKAIFIISFPPFIAAFLIILLVSWLVYAFGLIIGKDLKLGKQKRESVYVVRDESGFERQLKFFDHGQTYGETREESRSYNRFRDDLGNFWRSYDGEKTFVRERPGQQSYEL